MAVILRHKLENAYFAHMFFFNLDISLIIAPIWLKTFKHIANLEGRVSQHFDIGLRFCYIQCRIRFFEQNDKKHQSCLFLSENINRDK